nr:MAG TPA: hypothetical protein [Caudoviricetes sp.]
MFQIHNIPPKNYYHLLMIIYHKCYHLSIEKNKTIYSC